MVPAAFLAEVEDAIGSSVAKYFDLIVGTSTGGIIALGLGLGMSAAEIRTFYQELGPQVFAASRSAGLIRRIFRPRYSSEPLRAALKEAFGDLRLGDSKARLVIPAFNVDLGKVHLYKTAHHAHFERDHQELAVDVALATAAAPTYFPAHRTAHGIPLVDGGVWANNPIAVAVVEAIGVLDWRSEDVRVVSLGCVEEPISARHHAKDGRGQLYWARKVSDVFMAGQ